MRKDKGGTQSCLNMAYDDEKAKKGEGNDENETGRVGWEKVKRQ